jgi:flagellar biosynthesis protein FliQ
MDSATVLDVAREGIWLIIMVSAPMMIVGLLVGVVIALFQALTQIQELTLVFVPKIIAIFLTMLVVLPFMGESMSAYMQRVASLIVVGG